MLKNKKIKLFLFTYPPLIVSKELVFRNFVNNLVNLTNKSNHFLNGPQNILLELLLF